MNIYFDGVHLASPDLQALHAFVAQAGLKKHYYEGVRKGHPHYDVTNKATANKVIQLGVIIVSTRELIRKCYRNE